MCVREIEKRGMDKTERQTTHTYCRAVMLIKMFGGRDVKRLPFKFLSG